MAYCDGVSRPVHVLTARLPTDQDSGARIIDAPAEV